MEIGNLFRRSEGNLGTVGVVADFVYGLNQFSLVLHKMCSIEQTWDDLLDKLGE
jgi:hypothetical protein